MIKNGLINWVWDGKRGDVLIVKNGRVFDFANNDITHWFEWPPLRSGEKYNDIAYHIDRYTDIIVEPPVGRASFYSDSFSAIIGGKNGLKNVVRKCEEVERLQAESEGADIGLS